MMSYSWRYCSDTSRKVFSLLISPPRSFPRSCKYQSSAISLALERLSSFVLVRRFLPAIGGALPKVTVGTLVNMDFAAQNRVVFGHVTSYEEGAARNALTV